MDVSNLNISGGDFKSYSTPYCDVSKFKSLKIVVYCDKPAKLICIWSVDGVRDCIYSSREVFEDEWSSHTIEVQAYYLKFQLIAIETCQEATLSVLAKQADSQIDKLISLFDKAGVKRVNFADSEPPETDNISIEEPEPEKAAVAEGPKKKSILRNFKIHQQKKEEIASKMDERLPTILNKGTILVVNDNRQKVTCLAPPSDDGRVYMLVCVNKTVKWCAVGDNWTI